MKPGDKITVIDFGVVRRATIDSEPIELVNGAVDASWTAPIIDLPDTWQRDTHAIGSVDLTYREGIDWIRGWYEEGSPELVALLAAHALSSR